MKQYILIYIITLFTCFSQSYCETEVKRIFNITYQSENYKVPSDEIWKLTWNTPYKAGEVRPGYDVRVLGSALNSEDMGTWIKPFSTSNSQYLDVYAGISKAEIWIPWNTEFYLANHLIKAKVLVYNKMHLIKHNKTLNGHSINKVSQKLNSTENNNDWLTEPFSRKHKQGFYTTRPEEIKAFRPSGIVSDFYQFKDITVLHNKGIYWSNESQTDDSKDMLASIIAYKNNKKVFVARAYKFQDFKLIENENIMECKMWSGVMGSDEVKRLSLDFSEETIKIKENF